MYMSMGCMHEHNINCLANIGKCLLQTFILELALFIVNSAYNIVYYRSVSITLYSCAVFCLCMRSLHVATHVCT